MEMLTEKIGKSLPEGTRIGWFSNKGKLFFGKIEYASAWSLENNKPEYLIVVRVLSNQNTSSHHLFRWDKYFLAEDDNVVMMAMLEQ